MTPIADDAARSLAGELVALDFASLADADLRQLERLILDYCGVTIGGATHGWMVALKDWARRYGGSGTSPIIASDVDVASDVAAFVNGSAAHSFEFDDNHDASMCHIGAVVIPAALAVGAELDTGGRVILAAIAAGYEMVARIGIAANAKQVIAAGYHPTPLFGVFGAATAAAKLMGFDSYRLAAAWGHALSLAGGSMQFSLEPAGADVKRLHGGHAARQGVIAAQMVDVGVSAPRQSLGGHYGFLSLYGRSPRPQALLETGSRGLAIHDVSLKPYACCRLLHSVIDALRELTDNFALGESEIRGITVRGPAKLAEQHMETRPETGMAAQYSLPFTVGAVLAYGPDRFDAYLDAALGDPAILRWVDRVAVGFDAGLEEMFPDKYGTEAELTLTDGRVRTLRVIDSIGTPVNPMSDAQLYGKVRALIAPAGRPDQFDAVVRAIGGLRHDEPLRALHRAVRFPAIAEEAA